MFDYVDVEAERKKELDIELELETLRVLEWIKEEELRCPIQLESSYALRAADGRIVGECKPFTNVTFDFVGFLDYVLFEPSRFQLAGRLYLPGSFNELNRKTALRNGHLLPSYVWPSDHLAVGAHLSIPIPHDGADSLPASMPIPDDSAGAHPEDMFCGIIGAPALPTEDRPTVHKPRCGCGCIPPILSLFEMAELRKQAKLRTQLE